MYVLYTICVQNSSKRLSPLVLLEQVKTCLPPLLPVASTSDHSSDRQLWFLPISLSSPLLLSNQFTLQAVCKSILSIAGNYDAYKVFVKRECFSLVEFNTEQVGIWLVCSPTFCKLSCDSFASTNFSFDSFSSTRFFLWLLCLDPTTWNLPWLMLWVCTCSSNSIR